MSAKASKTKAPVVTREERAETRAWLLKMIMIGAGAWTREARVLLALAEQRGITLDEQVLMNADVQDLQRWQACLRARPQQADVSWYSRSPDGSASKRRQPW